MVEVRRAESDADYDLWRRVRLVVDPEGTQTVAQMRAGDDPERLLLLATVDGEVVASGICGRSDLAGSAFVIPRVLPAARRRGVGTALLRALAAHVATLGYPVVNSEVDDPGSLVFAERFGFREIDRQVKQGRDIGDEPPAEPPPGVRIVSVRERPELWRAAYDTVGAQAFQDMVLVAPVRATVEEWEREWRGPPEATFMALSGDEVIGCAGLAPDADLPGLAEHTLTAVRRDWRGRGVATALKRATLAWAASHGVREVYTWTQRGNEGMRRLNTHLGYDTRAESVTVRATLPLSP